VSDRTGTASFFQAEPGDGASSLYSVSHAIRVERETRVRTVSFSEAKEQMNREVSLAKIDCEAAEYNIVGRAPLDAWKCVKRIVIEYHPAPAEKVDALRARFVERGFILFKERRRTAGEGTFWPAREKGESIST
jgi:Methyltransferase FkbM domain